MSNQKINVSSADLTHIGHACNAIPYGIAIVAACALKNFGDKIKVDIFKEPNDFTEYLENTIPKVACFSNYIWNINLSYEFARRIKNRFSDTVIVFGGPNYPIDIKAQEEFLLLHPVIDFYIYKEGEMAFVDLFNNLLKYNFDIEKIKERRLNISNCHYINDGKIFQGNLAPPLKNLDNIPSPYLLGLCDKFLAKNFLPLVQTTRGCPFACTYCQEGDEYYNLIRIFSRKRIADELEYIAQRTQTPNLALADSNFGMYEEDLEICQVIASVQKKYNWPKYFVGIEGKNQKDRILKASSLIQGASLSAAVQSTDKGVLKNIKRQNVSLGQMIQIAKEGEALGLNTFSELILCLPGDTKDAHFKSNSQLIDSGINVVRSHQFIMLPGAEASSEKSRAEYGMKTRFRVVPNTLQPYKFFGDSFYSPEIDEICVANNTLSFEEYLECRQFNLTVEIFYNNGIFLELFKFLKLNSISISSFIMQLHKQLLLTDGTLLSLYSNFLRETKELWENPEELKAFLQKPYTLDRFLSGEMGNNEQLMYRAFAIFKHMEVLHKTIFDNARDILRQKACLGEENSKYLDELFEFSLLRKKDILSTDIIEKKLFHYDFINLASSSFNAVPLSCYKPEGLNFIFYHTDEQKGLIAKYIDIYGLSNYGLGNILSKTTHISDFYRKVATA